MHLSDSGVPGYKLVHPVQYAKREKGGAFRVRRGWLARLLYIVQYPRAKYSVRHDLITVRHDLITVRHDLITVLMASVKYGWR